MTRHDYVILAQWMRDTRPSGFAQRDRRTMWDGMLESLCNRLERDNERFDRTTFIKAALDVR